MIISSREGYLLGDKIFLACYTHPGTAEESKEWIQRIILCIKTMITWIIGFFLHFLFNDNRNEALTELDKLQGTI